MVTHRLPGGSGASLLLEEGRTRRPAALWRPVDEQPSRFLQTVVNSFDHRNGGLRPSRGSPSNGKPRFRGSFGSCGLPRIRKNEPTIRMARPTRPKTPIAEVANGSLRAARPSIAAIGGGIPV